MKSEKTKENLLMLLGIIIASIWQRITDSLQLHPIVSFLIISILVILAFSIHSKLFEK